MKTVELFRDFDYHAHPRKTIRFHANTTYTRVLELAAHQIERAGAGRILEPPPGAAGTYLTRDLSRQPVTPKQREGGSVATADASHAFRVRNRRTHHG